MGYAFMESECSFDLFSLLFFCPFCYFILYIMFLFSFFCACDLLEFQCRSDVEKVLFGLFAG